MIVLAALQIFSGVRKDEFSLLDTSKCSAAVHFYDSASWMDR